MTFVVKGRHVLALLLGFFAVTIGVNAVFVIYALGTFTGEDTPKPYLKGLAYNQTLAERATQAKLGWHATIDVVREGDGATVDVSLEDKSGDPRNGLTLDVSLRRPTNAALDRTLALAPSGDGRYSAHIAALAGGQWDVVVRAASGDGLAFEATRRVMLK